MGSFLSRLAGRTLGLVAIAEPIIPARLSPRAPEVARPPTIAADAAEWGEHEPARAGLRDGMQDARAPIRARRDAVAETDARPQETVRSTRQPDTVLAHAEAFRSEPAPERAEEGVERRAADFERPRIAAQPANVFREMEIRPAPPMHVDPLQPMRARTLESRARVPAPEAVHDEAPRIQVSIGRIEIRAEVAATAAVPRRSRPATLSLSDYLRQQGEARS